MGLYPEINKPKPPFFMRDCNKCKTGLGADSYIQTKSEFYPDGYLPICNDCIEEYLIKNDFNWEAVDKLCRYADIPFIPKEFERLKKMNGTKVFPFYAEVFLAVEYESIGWKDYHEAYKKLKDEGILEEELPLLEDTHRQKLRDKWGAAYNDYALKYLESLYQGLLLTQNVSGVLQTDQALKICKISYEIDQNIEDGREIDKLLASYDKLIKSANFTPKNAKNAGDFESIGEFFRWLEKRGFVNQFYDGATRDVVDETLKNVQNFNQRLYTNESGIGEEITRRIKALENVAEKESYYQSDTEYDLDEFAQEGYKNLFEEEEEEEFDLNLGKGDYE